MPFVAYCPIPFVNRNQAATGGAMGSRYRLSGRINAADRPQLGQVFMKH
jgi:hypothetical protein